MLSHRKLGIIHRLIEACASAGPGNVVLLEIESEQLTEVISEFGERGLLAEAVADRAVKHACRYLAMGVAVGEHLADQLLLPMAILKDRADP